MTKRPSTKMRRIAAEELTIHPIAQRKVVKTHLAKVIRDLKLDAIGVIHVVIYERGGVTAYWVIDGQHRILALLHLGLGELTVDVMVHEDVQDDAAASDLMLKLMERASLNPYDRWVNELEAGKPVTVGTAAIVEEHGLTVARGTGDGQVACPVSLKKTYQKDEGVALDSTLATVIEAWGRTAEAVEGQIIQGVGDVFAKFNGKVNQGVLAKKLSKFPGGAPGLIGQAKTLKGIRSASMAKCVSEIVVDTYNKGRRVGQLPAL